MLVASHARRIRTYLDNGQGSVLSRNAVVIVLRVPVEQMS